MKALRPSRDARVDVSLPCTRCRTQTGVYLVLCPAPIPESFVCAWCLDPRQVAFDERGRVKTTKAAA